MTSPKPLMPTEPRVLGDFEGPWRIARDIMQSDGTQAHFDGVARWSPTPRGLSYSETGEMRVAELPAMTATRQYLWTDDLSVYFDDGRFFHQVPQLGGTTRHWCDPDQYDGTYDFTEWPNFTVSWRVRGPRKDYEMTSLYTPMR